MSFDRFSHIPPVDGKLVDRIVCNLKSQGIFDQFRKDCLADVDTKPAYQNLQQRVNGTVASFLANHTWQEDLNKSQLRESLRRHVQQGFLEVGVDRIVEQVVNPKIITVFLPKVEDVVYDCLGVEKPAKKSVLHPMFRSLPPPPIPPHVIKTETSQENSLSLLPKDLDPVSPGSVDFDTSEEQADAMNTSLQEIEPPPKEEITQNDSQMSGISDLSSHSSLHINEPPATESNTNKSNMVSSKDNTTSHQFENFANLNEKIKKSEITYSPNGMEVNNSDESDEESTEVKLEISDIKMETDESKEEEALNLNQNRFEEFRASAVVQSIREEEPLNLNQSRLEEFRASAVVQSIREEESSRTFSEDSRFSVSNHVKSIKSESVSDHESGSMPADEVLKRESNEEIVNEDSQSKSSPCKKESERNKRKEEGSNKRQSESSSRHDRSHDSKHRSAHEKSSRDKEKSSSRSSKDDKPKSSSSKDKHKEEKNRHSEKSREREKEGGRSEHKEDSRSENNDASKSENKEDSRRNHKDKEHRRSENKENNRKEQKESTRNENKDASRREHKDASKSENKETSRSENKEDKREHKESTRNENKEASRREHKDASRSEKKEGCRSEHKENSKSENKETNRRDHKEDSRSENKEAGRSEHKESSRREHKEGNRSENKDERKEDKERHEKDKISRDKHSKDKDRHEKGKDRHEKDKDKHKEDHEKEKCEKGKIVEEKHKEEKIRDSERTEKSSHSSSSSNRKEDKHRSDDKEKSKRSSDGSSSKHRHSSDKSKAEEDKKESRDRKRKRGSCSEEVKSKEARRSWDRDNGEGRGSGSHRSGEVGKKGGSETSGRKQETERTEPTSNESSGNSDCLGGVVVEHLEDTGEERMEVDTGEERMEEVLMAEGGPSDVDMILMQINKSIEEEKSIEERRQALAAETVTRPDETECREVQSPPLKKPKIAKNMSEIRKIMLARKNINRYNMKKHRRSEPQEDDNSHVEEKTEIESTSPALVNLPSSDKIYPEENKENIKEVPQCDSRNKSTVDVASQKLIAETFSGFSDADIDQSSESLHCFRTSCIEYCHREGLYWSDSHLADIFTNSEEPNPTENKDILNNNVHIRSMSRNCRPVESEDKKEIIDLMSGKNGCYVRLDKDCPQVAEAVLRSENEDIPPPKGDQHRKQTISPTTNNGADTMNCADSLSLYSAMETATLNVESAEALLDNLMKQSVVINDNCEEENYDNDEEHETCSINCDSEWPEKSILDIIASVTATDRRSVKEELTANHLGDKEESQLVQDEEPIEVINNRIAERQVRRESAKKNRQNVGSQLEKEKEQSLLVIGTYNRVLERPATRRAIKNHIIHNEGMEKMQSHLVAECPTTNHISHEEGSHLEQSQLVESSEQALEKSQFKKGKTLLKRMIRGKEDINSTEPSNNRPQRNSRASQRYDSSDLYKPRPVIARATKRLSGKIDLYKPRPVIARATKRLSGKIGSAEDSPQVTQSGFDEALSTKRKFR